MAATQLNTFKTIRHTLTTSNVGIYTAPVNVATVVLNLQAANVHTGVSSITAFHSRGGGDIEIVKDFPIPTKDTGVLIDKKLVLETDDILKVQGTGSSEIEVILSVLETAKQ
jgi:hypothetical protein